MRALWIAGVVHAAVGSLMFFLTLHPLRDALEAGALESAKVGYGWQAMMGLAAMVAAAATRARLAGWMIVGGAAISAAMLSYIIFTGERPPIIVLVPTGGMIATIGLILLAASAPMRPQP